MATEHIAVTGIRPREDSIAPLGHHLRWAFPKQLGFPAKGFVIYRRLSGGLKSDRCLDFTKVPNNQNVSSLEGVSFFYPSTVQIRRSNSNLTVDSPSPELLELRFSEPMSFVHISVRGVQGSVQLRAYAGLQLIAASPPTNNSGFLEVTAPHITRVTIPLNFRTLVSVCHLSMDAVCEDKDWGQPIAELPLLRSVEEALKRLETDLQNRYAPTGRQLAVQRYERELGALLKWLNLLQNPTSAAFANPGARPDQLQLTTLKVDSPLQSIHPQAMLLLSALDPNIARFLSLYWVDQYSAANAPPQPGRAYDYKVLGGWEDHNVGCGLVFGLGAKESALPFVDEPLEGDQLPGLRWQGKTPLGRVGLRWPRPKEGQGAVQPILFDLWRDPGSGRETFLTKNQPVLVPAQSWANDGTALFIDTAAPLGQYGYTLRAIDLFGQVSQAIKSKAIAVKDLEAPPPPVRLRANLIQPGYPWRLPEQLDEATGAATLTLQFEYGDAQHRQAPDANTFRVYWQAESMFVTRSVTVQRVSSQALEDNLKIHTVRVQSSDPLDLGSFVGGKLSRESGTDTPLPATERHHYQIAKVPSSDQLPSDQLPSDQLQLAPSEHSFVNGSYRLISDPRLRTNWTQINFTTPISVRQPLQGMLQSLAPFQAKVTKVETLTPRQDQLALMPASHRPTQLDEPPPIVEVELDRRLLETDLFAGGTLQVGGQTYPILYSTSGSESPARLGLPPGTNISIGATLTLRPFQPFQPFPATIQQIERLPSNRLGITLPAQGNSAGTAHLLGGIVTIEGQRHSILQAQEESAGLRLELRPVGALPTSLNSWLGRTAQLSPPILQALTIQGTVPDEVAKVPGGEIAFDITQNGQLVTYVGRVVSDIGTVANGFNLLVSLSPAAQAALQPNTTRCRYYAPYRQEVNVRLPITRENTNSATTIDLPMAVGQSSQNLYLAVTTDDVRANEGPLSSPAQVMAVKPPPTGAPSRPYPCGQDAAAEAGYATPPDRQGRATLCLAWDAETLASTEGLRYEVARALDNTILATHRRNWLLGGPSLGTAISVSGTLSGEPFDETRGLYRVVLTADLGGAEPAAFRGGRLAQNGGFFQITTIAAGDAGTVQLMLRPMAKNVPTNGNAAIAGLPVPTNGAAAIERLPDYDAAVRDSVVDLRQLAKDNPDAFSLVTGVPIPNATNPDTGVPLRETRFRDEIPGIGRNRFFYRVRAVDAAENRSDWSGVSVPFYQVDTTPPEVPYVISARGGERHASFRVLREPESEIVAYWLYRARAETELADLSARIPDRRVYLEPASGQEQMQFVPIQSAFGLVNLPLPGGNGPATITGVYRKLDNGQPATTLDLFTRNPTRLGGRIIVDVNPILANETQVVVVIKEDDHDVLNILYTSYNEPAALCYSNQIIDLRFPYTITEVVGIYRVIGENVFDFSAQPIDNQISENFARMGITYDATHHTITGLAPGLQVDEPVVIIARQLLSNGTSSLLLLNRRVGSVQLPVFDGITVSLDTPIPPGRIVGIYCRDEFDFGSAADAQTAFNYTLSESHYNPDNRSISMLNPVVQDSDQLIVIGKTAENQDFSLEIFPTQVLILDAGLEASRPDEHYYYRLVALRRVLTRSDSHLDIPSAPTGIITIHPFDNLL